MKILLLVLYFLIIVSCSDLNEDKSTSIAVVTFGDVITETLLEVDGYQKISILFELDDGCIGVGFSDCVYFDTIYFVELQGIKFHYDGKPGKWIYGDDEEGKKYQTFLLKFCQEDESNYIEVY